MDSTTKPQQESVPSRKLSVILENTKECNQDDILRAVADVVGGNNILYASKLSGGRFCLYLSSESAVTTICARGGVNVNNSFLKCRKYVSDATKLLLSNCPPEMSDDTLLELLKPYGKAVSKPTRLGVSTVHNDLKHVLTWKRSVYMNFPNDAPPCPQVLHVTSREGTKHSIYIQTNQTPCYFCKSRSHPAEECTEENFPAYMPSPVQRLAKKSRNTSLIEPQTNQVDSTSKKSSSEDLKKTLTSKSNHPPSSPLVPLSVPVVPTPLPLPPPTAPHQPQSADDVPNSYSIATQSKPTQLSRKNKSLSENPIPSLPSNKRLLSPQSPLPLSSKIPKQSEPQPNTWTLISSPIPNPIPECSQELSEIIQISSSMSFNENKLSKETFLNILSHCNKSENIRRIVHKYVYIYKCNLDIAELMCKLNELSTLLIVVSLDK
ncbi:Transposon TX1 uncharacterized 82 kDa protein [Frankliniella fusca]|uniref:Transposon TX1 uncharacterized 82 kDa protein n=1 Tax=Frankliniella fusca TaxID=407009 RepID=A0AAE1H1G7_9NEOP|nr:Transposon TX1 uncharacterized 82 kDa protein [Frankliniella fusca]